MSKTNASLLQSFRASRAIGEGVEELIWRCKAVCGGVVEGVKTENSSGRIGKGVPEEAAPGGDATTRKRENRKRSRVTRRGIRSA